MNYTIKLFFFLIIFTGVVFSQDSVRIYILSKDIGPVITSDERKQYDLFPKLKDEFISGFFVMHKERFYLYYSVKKENQPADTLISYTYISYLNTSKRIQAIKNKEKNLKTDPTIEYIDTVISIPLLSGISQSSDFNKIVNLEEMKKMEESMIEKEKPKLLPLVKSEVDVNSLLKSQLMFYLGAGPAFRTGLDNINKIYNMYEETITFKEKVPLSSENYTPGLLINISTLLIFRDFIFAEINYSFTPYGKTTDRIDYSSFEASLGYRYKLSPSLYPYISAGYTGNHFFYDKTYNKYIEHPGGYNVDLLSIKVDGNSKGFDLKGGLMYESANVLILNFYAGYQFMKRVTINEPYYLNINAGGFIAGLTVMVR